MLPCCLETIEHRCEDIAVNDFVCTLQQTTPAYGSYQAGQAMGGAPATQVSNYSTAGYQDQSGYAAPQAAAQATQSSIHTHTD